MSFKLHYGDFPALLVLLEAGQQARFRKAVENGLGKGGTDAVVYESLHSAALSDNERVVFRFGYSILRGFGPGLQPHTLWGLDRRVLERILAAIARAVDPQGAPEALLRASELCQKASEADRRWSATTLPPSGRDNL